MRALSLTSMFGLGELVPERHRALILVFSTSVALVMGVNFIQPALPALTQPFGISDSALGLVMTMLTAPAIFLAPMFGVVADLFGRRLLWHGESLFMEFLAPPWPSLQLSPGCSSSGPSRASPIAL